MNKKRNIPTVDVRQFTQGKTHEKEEFIRVFGDGLKEFGFVNVEGHGIPSQLIKDCYSTAEKFFALDDATKRSYEVKGGGGQRGYTGFGKEHAKNVNIGDLKEFWHVGREVCENPDNSKLYPANIWPEKHLPEFKKHFFELYSKLDGFAATLLEATSVYLSIPQQTLPKMVKDGNSILRVLHYPPLKDSEFKSGAVRAAAHEDINFITILCEATESGLEILTRDGEWLSIEVGPGQMVVDSGDMLSRICNDVIPSTTHRVVNPPNAQNKPRFSMPFFVHPYSTCHLEVLPTCVSPSRPAKYPPCTADEFLQQRLREIGLVKA